ncbi:GNAT family acetyltransferase [Kushneria aurantia]|uniref:GNAT family acetyltransferase n=1 Tax=Kushneria aurantia TaxID=504092 RepID=UPI000687DD7A|nr:GNAT family acetyltransferase [Kushneria aurantia]
MATAFRPRRPFFAHSPFRREERDAVIALWQRCELTRPWNDPVRDIERKLSEDPALLLIGADELDRPIASAMVGYDGHRGWLYYLAVDTQWRGRGYGRALVERAETLLIERGCPKLMLMVRQGQPSLERYYHQLGFSDSETVTLGKRLIRDE